MSLIKPQTLKGFRDFLPPVALARERLMETARRVYRSYGFTAIDTPALEYAEILLGKGGAETDKQVYRFTDQGDRDVCMRYDLTVPFARYAAQHLNEIGMPFKRYHLGSVWRGENTHRGRYREFVQCDFDTIGTDSNTADIETLLVIHDLMTAVGFEGQFTIQVNNRLILNGLLDKLGLAGKTKEVLIALDKLPKIGPEAVTQEMTATSGASADQARQLLDMAALTGSPDGILAKVDPLLAGNEQGERGISRLRELFAATRSAGIDPARVALDVSIARGLDYYTGTIYETFLTADRKIGSVCSGGRYDNLAGLFTNQRLPGVGASLGLDRLLAAQESLGQIAATSSPAQVLIVNFDAGRLAEYLTAARQLREAGLNVELYPEARDISKQLKYVDRKGIPVVVIAGEKEFAAGTWQVNTKSEKSTVPAAELVEAVKSAVTKS